MSSISKIAICLLLCSLMVVACKKEKDFSKIPEIETRDFYMTSDTSAIWVVGFTDGDGNIGIREDEDFLPNNFPYQVYSIKNKQITLLEDTVKRGFRIPPINGVETKNGIEGELQLSFTGLDLFVAFGVDSIYFSGYLIDRDKNQSNILQTPILGLN